MSSDKLKLLARTLQAETSLKYAVARTLILKHKLDYDAALAEAKAYADQRKQRAEQRRHGQKEGAGE